MRVGSADPGATVRGVSAPASVRELFAGGSFLLAFIFIRKGRYIMKKTKIAFALLMLAMLLFVAACGAAEEESAADGAVTITDMTGREITIDEPVTRVVALSAADCEFLYAIGAGDALVGRGEYCDYPTEVLDLPAVQSGMDTNIEQIIELEPQVLLIKKIL